MQDEQWAGEGAGGGGGPDGEKGEAGETKTTGDLSHQETETRDHLRETETGEQAAPGLGELAWGVGVVVRAPAEKRTPRCESLVNAVPAFPHCTSETMQVRFRVPNPGTKLKARCEQQCWRLQ